MSSLVAKQLAHVGLTMTAVGWLGVEEYNGLGRYHKGYREYDPDVKPIGDDGDGAKPLRACLPQWRSWQG
jgi:hypothetical protein